jgi:hypothetical protein
VSVLIVAEFRAGKSMVRSAYSWDGDNCAMQLRRQYRRADRDQKANGNEMTPDQSRLLKVGSRVCFNGDQTDRGKVTAVQARYVTIKWDDGHQSFSGHGEMDRVELVKK